MIVIPTTCAYCERPILHEDAELLLTSVGGEAPRPVLRWHVLCVRRDALAVATLHAIESDGDVDELLRVAAVRGSARGG